jgi:hypothetical protein
VSEATQWKRPPSIILGIRGTASLSDLVTDIAGNTVSDEFSSYSVLRHKSSLLRRCHTAGREHMGAWPLAPKLCLVSRAVAQLVMPLRLLGPRADASYGSAVLPMVQRTLAHLAERASSGTSAPVPAPRAEVAVPAPKVTEVEQPPPAIPSPISLLEHGNPLPAGGDEHSSAPTTANPPAALKLSAVVHDALVTPYGIATVLQAVIDAYPSE